jgi:catechol 2,3-dioxygenase-like lactoylglutathione lyase family enzyme
MNIFVAKYFMKERSYLMAQNTFHVALNVKDLPTAIEQYRKILGVEPAKVKPDYAKFELVDPPAIISLNLGGEPGTVSHLGIRHAETEAVAAELVRTKANGVAVREQQGATCCYAKADKYWVRDADGMEWEMYTLLEDAAVHSIGATPEERCCSPAAVEQDLTQPQATSSCCTPAMNAPTESSLAQIQAKRACG